MLVLFCIDVVSGGVPLHNDSLLPRRLLPAGLGRAGEEGQALLLPLPALALAQVLSLLPLCPAHGVWRSLGKHLGMDFSLSTSGRRLWALPGCCGRGAGCWTWTRLCSFRQGQLAVAARRDPPQMTSLLYSPYPHPISLPGNSLTSCFPSLPSRGQAMLCHGPPYTI